MLLAILKISQYAPFSPFCLLEWPYDVDFDSTYKIRAAV
ncbi:hypothetical protein T09_1194 [Trichinella sp. T9]|nr:hypothetical protein T09_1194 [Trichinella sp. T9]